MNAQSDVLLPVECDRYIDIEHGPIAMQSLLLPQVMVSRFVLLLGIFWHKNFNSTLLDCCTYIYFADIMTPMINHGDLQEFDRRIVFEPDYE